MANLKQRLDKLIVERGLAASRERAQALILAGRVLVDQQKIEKPGTAFPTEVAIRLLGDDLRYVSRGGLKLEAALSTFAISPAGRACADIGASTGGFTDCLLQHGAASVLAVDTGYGQIAQKLRDNTLVQLLERTNARKLAPGELAGLRSGARADSTPVTLLVMDVSFISVSLVIGPVVAALAAAGETWRGDAVVLVKPQFEAGREHVGKGGIVRDPAAHDLAVRRVQAAVQEAGGLPLAVIPSPILGAEGNREFLLRARFD